MDVVLVNLNKYRLDFYTNHVNAVRELDLEGSDYDTQNMYEEAQIDYIAAKELLYEKRILATPQQPTHAVAPAPVSQQLHMPLPKFSLPTFS